MTEEQRVPIMLCEAGMELSRPLSDGGTHLCAAGTVLNERLLAQLSVRGVKRAWIRGQPHPAKTHQSLEQQTEALRERFSRIKQQPSWQSLSAASNNA